MKRRKTTRNLNKSITKLVQDGFMCALISGKACRVPSEVLYEMFQAAFDEYLKLADLEVVKCST